MTRSTTFGPLAHGSSLPMTLLALPAGAWADMLDRRAIVLMAHAVAAAGDAGTWQALRHRRL